MKPRNTRRLALSYFGIIMTMSLVFSAVIFSIVTTQLSRPLPLPNDQGSMQLRQDFDERVSQRDAQTKSSVFTSLIAVNVLVAAGGAGFSYYLARRTLRPIEKAMDAQVQFVNDASHELRTPLTALQTSAEVTLRKPVIKDEKAREVLTRTIIETGKLRDLADALLSLAKTERHNDTAAAILASDVTGAIIDRLQPLANKKHIDICVEHSTVSVIAVRSVVEQILTILVDNAIKYSPEHTNVSLTIKREGKNTLFIVRDQGIGIDKKDQAKIFERFYRADAARTRTDMSGHGLGLAIAQQLAEGYNYKITFESEIGVGSVFTLVV